MGVVARIRVNSVEDFGSVKEIKLSPVVGVEDPNDEEIKKFFAATPAGNVAIRVPFAEATPKAGDQFYLYLKSAKGEEKDPAKTVTVKTIRLDGWATYVELKADGTPTLYEPAKMSFTIRNEAAAEQFQIGSEFQYSLELVPSS